MARLVKGSALTAEQVREVKRRFAYRWTSDNPQRCQVYRCSKCDIRVPYVNTHSADGHTHPTIPLQTDAEWLADHAFYINNDGSLSDRYRYCEPVFMVGV